MKIARLYSFGDIRIEEMPVPSPGPGEALMKTMASGICSGDLMPWYIEKKAPLVLGHEPAGVIVKTGSGVEDFSEGDRVSVHHHAPCMDREKCPFCKKGIFVHCPAWKNSFIIPGGISEYILIPAVNLRHDTLKLSPVKSLSFEDGVLVEPLGCVLKGLRRAGLPVGENASSSCFDPGTFFVFVIGLGVMGILHILALKALGIKAENIIGADSVPFRLEKALGLGAGHVVDVSREDPVRAVEKITNGRMADLVIAGPNSVRAMHTAVEAAGPGGKVVLFTPAKPGEVLSLDPNDIYFREVSLIPSYSTGPVDTRAALAMIEGGHVRADMIVTHSFPIGETQEAYRLAARAADSLKVLIRFQ